MILKSLSTLNVNLIPAGVTVRLSLVNPVKLLLLDRNKNIIFFFLVLELFVVSLFLDITLVEGEFHYEELELDKERQWNHTIDSNSNVTLFLNIPSPCAIGYSFRTTDNHTISSFFMIGHTNNTDEFIPKMTCRNVSKFGQSFFVGGPSEEKLTFLLNTSSEESVNFTLWIRLWGGFEKGETPFLDTEVALGLTIGFLLIPTFITIIILFLLAFIRTPTYEKMLRTISHSPLDFMLQEDLQRTEPAQVTGILHTEESIRTGGLKLMEFCPHCKKALGTEDNRYQICIVTFTLPQDYRHEITHFQQMKDEFIIYCQHCGKTLGISL